MITLNHLPDVNSFVRLDCLVKSRLPQMSDPTLWFCPLARIIITLKYFPFLFDECISVAMLERGLIQLR